jgi:hypothetical protein
MDGQLAAQALGIAHDHSTESAGREELEKLKQDLEQARAENDRLKWAHKMVLKDWREEQARTTLYKDFLKQHFGISLLQ